MIKAPTVAVLVASHNGDAWIAEQIQSIIDSSNVLVHIFLSDDNSGDDTEALARALAKDRIKVLPKRRLGSAAANFFRLILDSGFDDYDYVALSDQDDIWRPEKLQRAISTIEQVKCDAYSSDVIAFWPNGRRKYIRKSHPMREHDYLFESAGPGNTFVFPASQAKWLRESIAEIDPAELARISLHDWMIYALFRSRNKKWFIDSYAGLFYRQHDQNVLGASVGMKSALARIGMMRRGWYRWQILHIARICGVRNDILEYIEKPTISRSWIAASHATKCRRRFRDAFVVSAYLLFLPLILRSSPDT